VAHDPAAYGDAIADVYDDLHGFMAGVDDIVDLLAELAGGGPALELGIGTGRLALPLAARGVKVHGIDASAKMLARLRAKPGGADIEVTLGDFADLEVDASFSLVFVCFNTFFGLLTQEAQLRCFARAAARLLPGGRFLIEAFVPDATRFPNGQGLNVQQVGGGSASFAVSRHEPIGQRVSTSQVVVRDGSVRVYPIEIRYTTVAELDLMARGAGLRLEHRWSSWKRAPFGPGSAEHISVYA